MRLKSDPGDLTRPITDRVKESLFNIIGADIHHASMFDLFSGTGSVGIEALSRGADFVRFNDHHRLAVNTIRENLARTKLTEKADVLQNDAFELLRGEVNRSFDYVFIAPPQYKNMWSLTLKILDENLGWLAGDAWVIVQIDPTEFEPLEFKKLVAFDQRKYGSTLLLFYTIPTQA